MFSPSLNLFRQGAVELSDSPFAFTGRKFRFRTRFDPVFPEIRFRPFSKPDFSDYIDPVRLRTDYIRICKHKEINRRPSRMSEHSGESSTDLPDHSRKQSDRKLISFLSERRLIPAAWPGRTNGAILLYRFL